VLRLRRLATRLLRRTLSADRTKWLRRWRVSRHRPHKTVTRSARWWHRRRHHPRLVSPHSRLVALSRTSTQPRILRTGSHGRSFIILLARMNRRLFARSSTCSRPPLTWTAYWHRRRCDVLLPGMKCRLFIVRVLLRGPLGIVHLRRFFV
jgi:hypothetical protein